MKTFEEYQYRFSIPHNKVRGYKYTPNNKKELIEAIEAEIEEQGPNADLNCINTSNITDMSHTFDANSYKYAKNFNGDISNWNTSNVINTRDMFYCAINFNQDISNWNVSNVKDMYGMFTYAEKFNGNISRWNVSNVKNMCYMFYNAKSFNQDISNWNVSNAKEMNRMFYYAESFNQDISGWNVSNVWDMRSIFTGCAIKEEYKPKFK